MYCVVFNLTCLFFVFNSLSAQSGKLTLDIQAEAAILINADTGAILYEKNMHDHHYPASITKIATTSYALNRVGDRLDVMITADQDCIGTVTEESIKKSNYTIPSYYLVPDASHIGIKKGEILSLRDLLYGLMVASGDDAANVIAKHVSGTIPQFVDELNAYVRDLGCMNTVFYNPHGLHHPKQYTSAYDMAILTKDAMKNSLFSEIVRTSRYTRPKTNKQEPSILIQTNRLLRPGKYFYSKAIGVKTGYYSLASTLVAAATDEGRTLIAVILKSKDGKQRFLDARMMFEAAFNQPKVRHTLLSKGSQKFTRLVTGAKEQLTTYINEPIAIEYYPAEDPKAKCLLFWDKEITAPISQGQRVGELIVQSGKGHILNRANLYAEKALDITWNAWFQSLFSVHSGYGVWMKIMGGVIFLIFLSIFGVQLKRKSK